jgi:multisubunit Na+/H+ antiporter MnhB subunit
VRAVAPLMVLVATYLLWAGTTQPGGAFQAGAVLGAAGLLLLLSGRRAPETDRPFWRALLAGGLAVFLAAFFSGMLPAVLLAVEAAIALSIATALVCLFAAPRR